MHKFFAVRRMIYRKCYRHLVSRIKFKFLSMALEATHNLFLPHLSPRAGAKPWGMLLHTVQMMEVIVTWQAEHSITGLGKWWSWHVPCVRGFSAKEYGCLDGWVEHDFRNPGADARATSILECGQYHGNLLRDRRTNLEWTGVGTRTSVPGKEGTGKSKAVL